MNDIITFICVSLNKKGINLTRGRAVHIVKLRTQGEIIDLGEVLLKVGEEIGTECIEEIKVIGSIQHEDFSDLTVGDLVRISIFGCPSLDRVRRVYGSNIKSSIIVVDEKIFNTEDGINIFYDSNGLSYTIYKLQKLTEKELEKYESLKKLEEIRLKLQQPHQFSLESLRQIEKILDEEDIDSFNNEVKKH